MLVPHGDAHIGTVEEAVFDAILGYSNSLTTDAVVNAWSQQVLHLQEERRLPPASLSLVNSAASFGLAAARLEHEWAWERSGHTAELIHQAMAIAAYDNDDAEWLIRAVAIDGAYYIARTGHDAGAVTASL